jgi:hypothetical protein
MAPDQLQRAAMLGVGEGTLGEAGEQAIIETVSDRQAREWFDGPAASRPFLALGITLAAAAALIVFVVFLFVDGVR